GPGVRGRAIPADRDAGRRGGGRAVAAGRGGVLRGPRSPSRALGRLRGRHCADLPDPGHRRGHDTDRTLPAAATVATVAAEKGVVTCRMLTCEARRTGPRTARSAKPFMPRSASGASATERSGRAPATAAKSWG